MILAWKTAAPEPCLPQEEKAQLPQGGETKGPWFYPLEWQESPEEQAAANRTGDLARVSQEAEGVQRGPWLPGPQLEEV